MKEEKEGFIFSNENTVFRVATTAMITSWVILLIYVVSFVAGILPLLNGSASWAQVVAQPSTILNIVYPLVMGMVYFSVLQGITQLLHLGLDIFYSFEENDELDEVA